MSKDVCTLYHFTDTQYIGDCWDDMTYIYIVANAAFYASPYHLHQKHQEHYVYC